MIPASSSYPHSIARLARGDIHLWCADLNRAAPYLQVLAHTLSADELARARRFHFEDDRTRFVLRRGILRMCLGSYLAVAPSLLRFSYGRNGKPTLADTSGKDCVFFNLSHSNGIALYAFTCDGEIGVDIEQIHVIDDFKSVAASYFSPAEYQTWAAFPDSKKQEAFFSFWTCKEAYVKARGQGLALDLDQFTVSVASGQAKLLNVVGDPAEASRWSFYQFSPVHGHVATVAIAAPGCRLASRRSMRPDVDSDYHIQAHRLLCEVTDGEPALTDMARFATIRTLTQYLSQDWDDDDQTASQKGVDRARPCREAMMRRRQHR